MIQKQFKRAKTSLNGQKNSSNDPKNISLKKNSSNKP